MRVAPSELDLVVLHALFDFLKGVVVHPNLTFSVGLTPFHNINLHAGSCTPFIFYSRGFLEHFLASLRFLGWSLSGWDNWLWYLNLVAIWCLDDGSWRLILSTATLPADSIIELLNGTSWIIWVLSGGWEMKELREAHAL
tara:strand:- start:220 stop:639 length:420 start_codon:yes stop_codon:yes gene_type:complete